MEKKQITKQDINTFSIIGRIYNSPKKGFSKDKLYCDINLKTMHVKNYITVRVYGATADNVPIKYYTGDIVQIIGEFIETSNGIERVAKKITKPQLTGEFKTAIDEYRTCVKLYSPRSIEERKITNGRRTKK